MEKTRLEINVDNPRVSIIVPVYKTEKYLKECMDSVLEQDYGNLEIIMVDDGSPDNCPQICDDYEKAHENIRVIHKENSGLGLSRNAGLMAATGKYIYFLDSDDKLDGKGAISHLVKVAENNNAAKTAATVATAATTDITVGAYRRFNEEGVSEINHHNLRGGEYTRTAQFRFKGFYLNGHLAYNWGKLYRREFLLDNDLKCRSYPFTQDKAHNMACYSYKPVYAFTEESSYLYRVNEQSVTFRYKENLMPVWISIATDFRDFLKERGIKENYQDLMAFHIFFGSFFVAKQELQAGKGIIGAKNKLKEYGKNKFVRNCMVELSKGKYLKDVPSVSYRIMIWGASFLFSCHAYWLMAAVVAGFRKLQIDKKITDSHYKKKGARQ